VSDPLGRPGLRSAILLLFSGAFFFATYLVVSTYDCPKAFAACGLGLVIGLAWGRIHRARWLATKKSPRPRTMIRWMAEILLAIVLVILLGGILGSLDSLALSCELEASIPAVLGSTLAAWTLYNALFFLWVKVSGF
jgi:hypothetical protein